MPNFNYTVMRQVDIDQSLSDALEPVWIAWDVQATSAKEAVEDAADIPGVYLVYESDPIVFEMDNVTRLEVVQSDQSGE